MAENTVERIHVRVFFDCSSWWHLPVALLILLVTSGIALAGFGGGPSVIVYEYFRGDPSIVRGVYTCSSSDTDILGYTAESQIDNRFFSSINDYRNEVKYVEVSAPGPLRDESEIFVGQPDPTVFYTEDYNQWVQYKSIYPAPGGGGIQFGTGSKMKVAVRFRDPLMPKTAWTLDNTSSYDITDAFLVLDRYRIVPLSDIPAGGSIAINGQLQRQFRWSFGGILNSPTPQPVYAFDPATVPSASQTFADVFTVGSEYSGTGVAAGLVAHATTNGWKLNNVYSGKGSSLEDFTTDFSAPDAGSSSFALYAFPVAGVAQLVGQGTQAATFDYRDWDPTGTPGSPAGGGGDWNTTSAVWSDGATDHAWDNDADKDARFTGASGHVTVGETIWARSLTFDSTGYTLGGAGTLRTSYIQTAGASVEATISVPVHNKYGLRMVGQGRVTLSAANTYDANTAVSEGTLVVSADENLGDAVGAPYTIYLENGGTLEVPSGFETNRPITVKDGGTIHVVSGDMKLTNSVSVDASVFRKTGAGTLSLLGGANNIEAAGGNIYIANGGTTLMTELGFQGGTITLGKDGRRGRLQFTTRIASRAAPQTALIRPSPDMPVEDAVLELHNDRLTIDVEDGAADVDLDIAVGIVCVEDWGFYQFDKTGAGTLRFSGSAPLEQLSRIKAFGGIVQLANESGQSYVQYGLTCDDAVIDLLVPNQVDSGASLALYGGRLNLHNHSQQFGSLIAGRWGEDNGTAIIDLGDGATGQLTIENGWSVSVHEPLHIYNWNGSLTGGGSEAFVIESAHGVDASDIEHIRFVDPLGVSGVFDAQILDLGGNIGELVPVGVSEPSSLGDWDDDGDVDDRDLNLLLSAFEDPPSLQNEVDLTTLIGNFGRTDVGALAEVEPVPEPSTLAMAVLGILGLMGWGWQRRR